MTEKLVFPYGAQYYRPPNPPEKDWATDMSNMKNLGFNIVKIWAMWNWINIEPDKYDFEELDQVFDLAHKNGLKVILNTICENVPWWMAEKYPDAMYQRADGDTIEPMCWDNTPGGGWPGLCFDHPQVQKLAQQYLTQLAKRYKGHEALYGYDCWNEPHIEPISLQTPVVERNLYCYCENSIRNFSQWQKEKYGSIENLNESYHTKYTSFEQVKAPRRFGPVSLWMDWQRFWQDNLANILKWRYDTIKSVDSDHFVMAHVGLDGITTTISFKYCIDDWKLASVPDKWGCSWFPNWSQTDICEASLHIDITKSAAGDKDCWICELQPGGEPTAEIFTGSHPTKEDIALWNLSALATGMKGFLYWQYRPEMLGGEMGSLGMTNNDGSATTRTQIAGRLAKLFNSDSFYKQAQPQKASVAIIHSKDIHNFLFASKQQNNPVFESIKNLYAMLWKSNIPVKFINIASTNIDEISNYPVVFFPAPVCMSQEQADLLKLYAQQGGTLISESFAGEFDLNGYLSEKTPGFGLHKVFGCIRNNNWRQHDAVIAANDFVIKSSDYLESYTLLDNGTALAEHENKTAAIVDAAYGKGKAVMVGSFAFQNEENCKAILNLANLKVRNDIPYGIFLREINTDAEKAFVVFNWTKDQTISFKFTDQNTLDWQQGLIEFKDDYIKFAPRASAILRTKESLKNDK